MALVQGQKLKISALTQENALEIGICCRLKAPGESIDITCFGVDENSQLTDERYFVFYNQPASPNREIVKLGGSGPDDERFAVNTAALPNFIKKLVFTASIDGQSSMNAIADGYIRISAGGRELERYSFSGRNFAQEKALILAEIYFKSEWRLGIVSQGFNGGLSALLKHYGGQEEEEQNHGLAQHNNEAHKEDAPRPGQEHSGKNDSEYSGPVRQIGDQGSGERLSQRCDQPDADRYGGKAPAQSELTVLSDENRFFSLPVRQAEDMRIHLTWRPNRRAFAALRGRRADQQLDLGCMALLRDGSKHLLQNLGGYGGSGEASPYITLRRIGSGPAASDILQIHRPELIDRLLIYTFIYKGSLSFADLDASLQINFRTGCLQIPLTSPAEDRLFCALCDLKSDGSNLTAVKEEAYFHSHSEADSCYHFGFEWMDAT
ncbi:TerD family protein [bacterium]|nr:TerD family protein [bacterium]